MSRELMQQALEALNHVNVQDRVQIITALRLADALDAEFVQGRISNSTGRESAVELRRLALKQWVGLTDDEIKEIIGPWGETPIKGYTRKLFDQIEAKLKEKNT